MMTTNWVQIQIERYNALKNLPTSIEHCLIGASGHPLERTHSNRKSKRTTVKTLTQVKAGGKIKNMHGEKKIRTPMLRNTERTTCSLNFFSITNQKTSTTQMKQSCITERFQMASLPSRKKLSAVQISLKTLLQPQ